MLFPQTNARKFFIYCFIQFIFLKLEVSRLLFKAQKGPIFLRITYFVKMDSILEYVHCSRFSNY